LRNRLILVVVMMAVGLLTASRFVSDGDGIEVAATPPSSPMPEKTTSPSVGGSTSSTSEASVSTTTRSGEPVTPVDFTDSEHGWIGGQNRSCVYRTADGGRTWQGTSADPHARC
jgi:hypothetical protein